MRKTQIPIVSLFTIILKLLSINKFIKDIGNIPRQIELEGIIIQDKNFMTF